MIKTLRITSIVVVALAAGFVIFPVFFATADDNEIEKLLNSPGPIDKFKQAKDSKTTKGTDHVPPLVEQAKAFALYLNPPKTAKKPEARKTAGKTAKRNIPKPKAAVTPKFTLVATSFYASHPELSLALINEPATGNRWIRKSKMVGHLTIEEIKDGLVVVNDGTNTFELIAQRPPKVSLLKGQDPQTIPPAAPSTPAVSGKTVSAVTQPQTRPQPSPQESMEELLTKIAAMRVNIEEAKKLSNLGEELTDKQEDTKADQAKKARIERLKSRGSKAKIQKKQSEQESTESAR